MTTKSKVLSIFIFGTVKSWMLSVVNKIDSALQIGLSISRISLLVVKLLAFLVTPPLINPQAVAKITTVLMSQMMSLSDLLTHCI